MSHAQIEVMISGLGKSLDKIEENLDSMRNKAQLGFIDHQVLRILDGSLQAHEAELLRVAPNANAVQMAELLELSRRLVQLRQLVRSTTPS